MRASGGGAVEGAGRSGSIQTRRPYLGFTPCNETFQGLRNVSARYLPR